MLTAIADFCIMVCSFCGRAVKFAITWPMVIAECVASAVTFVISCWNDWPITNQIETFVSNVSTAYSGLVSSLPSDSFVSFCLSFFALDSLASWFAVAFGCTIGVVVFVFGTLVLLLLPLILVILAARLVMKLVQVFSLGFVDV